jgi:uncharacterized integral membrane protein
MRKFKLIVIILVSILTLIILLQNTEPVQAHVLFAKVQLSLALLMMLTFVLGFIVGILVPTYFLKKTPGKEKPGPGPSR